jgi:ADP-ribose pyrophosphatase
LRRGIPGWRIAVPRRSDFDYQRGEMMKQHGPWQIRSSVEVYRDPWIEVQKDEVIRPDGADGTHCIVRMKPGVSVVPLDADGFVYLTEEFHYGVGRLGLEAVSGGIEPGETAQSTAHRELQEELGIVAGRLHYLTTVDPFTTIIVSPTQLFLAEDLRFVDDAPEGTELIRRVRMRLAEALDAVRSGRITHAPTCVLLLLAASNNPT